MHHMLASNQGIPHVLPLPSREDDPTAGIKSWVYTCAEAWSPWLFLERSHAYTVVDSLTLHFHDGVMPDIKSALLESLGPVKTYNKERYKLWTGPECGFEFSYEPLDLHVTPDFVYFEDSVGRQSPWTLFLDDDDSGPTYTTATTGANRIPWLLCVY